MSDFNFPQTTDIQFVNLMPDSPTITATVTRTSDSKIAAADAEAFASGSAQGSIIVGNYDLAVSYLDADNNQRFLLDQKSIDYKDPDQFVYLFLGSITNPDEQTVHFTDPFFTGGISSNDVEVWFVNGASTPDQVDLYLTSASTPIEATTPTATVTAQTYTQPITLSNRTNWRLRVTPAGSTKVLFDSGAFSMVGGTRTLFAVTDYFGPTSTTPGSSQVLLNAIRVTTSGTQNFSAGDLPSELRIINLVRDLPPLDVYFGSTKGAPYAANVGQLTTTSYQNIDPGAYGLNVTENGIKDQFVLEQDVEFGSGTYYTMVLTGRYNGGGTDSTLNSVVFSTDPRPIHSRTKVNFINAGSVNNSVNVYLLAPGQAFGDNSPQVSDATPNVIRSVTLHSGMTDVVVTSADSKNIIIGPKRLVLNEGSTYTLVLVEDPVSEATQAKLLELQITPGG